MAIFFNVLDKPAYGRIKTAQRSGTSNGEGEVQKPLYYCKMGHQGNYNC